MLKTFRGKAVVFGIVLVIAIFCIYFGNNSVVVSRYSVKSDKIPDSFNGFKIVQISDLHNAEFGKDNKSLLQPIADAEPDIIVITGDLIDSMKTDVDVAVSFAEEAVKLAPVYYVNGNHEAAVPGEYKKLKDGLEMAGVTVLENETTDIAVASDVIKLTGINDPSFQDASEADYGQVLDELTYDEAYRILLAHRPECPELYADKADLVFSGHAHGGQFIIPFIGGVIAPNQGFFPKYYKGIYKFGNTEMVVSRGIGNSIIPVRINNKPEIVVTTLMSQ